MSKNKPKKGITVAISGYFNPVHVGHLRLIKAAKKLGDYLVVIVNNDQQVRLKGSIPFMSEKDRVEIVKALKWVDRVFLSIDQDATVCKSLRKIKPDIFANGGDRGRGNIPEEKVCQELNIKMVDNVGGKKIRSSSILLKKVKKHIKI